MIIKTLKYFKKEKMVKRNSIFLDEADLDISNEDFNLQLTAQYQSQSRQERKDLQKLLDDIKITS